MINLATTTAMVLFLGSGKFNSIFLFILYTITELTIVSFCFHIVENTIFFLLYSLQNVMTGEFIKSTLHDKGYVFFVKDHEEENDTFKCMVSSSPNYFASGQGTTFLSTTTIPVQPTQKYTIGVSVTSCTLFDRPSTYIENEEEEEEEEDIAHETTETNTEKKTEPQIILQPFTTITQSPSSNDTVTNSNGDTWISIAVTSGEHTGCYGWVKTEYVSEIMKNQCYYYKNTNSDGTLRYNKMNTDEEKENANETWERVDIYNNASFEMTGKSKMIENEVHIEIRLNDPNLPSFGWIPKKCSKTKELSSVVHEKESINSIQWEISAFDQISQCASTADATYIEKNFNIVYTENGGTLINETKDNKKENTKSQTIDEYTKKYQHLLSTKHLQVLINKITCELYHYEENQNTMDKKSIEKFAINFARQIRKDENLKFQDEQYEKINIDRKRIYNLESTEDIATKLNLTELQQEKFARLTNDLNNTIGLQPMKAFLLQRQNDAIGRRATNDLTVLRHVLLSGDFPKIELWRDKMALDRTKTRRPDLLD